MVTRNAALDFYRKEVAGRRYLQSTYAGTTHERSAEEEALHNSDADRVLVYLRELPADTRSLIHESFFERLPHSSIAQRRRMPLGTVKSRIRSALRSLRQTIVADAEVG